MSASASEALTPDPSPRPRRRSPWRRVSAVIVALVVVALVAGTVLVVMTVRKPLPETDAEIQLPGLAAEVTIVRDAQGVPQIYADSSADLFRAQGYVHAQDRFFQMDMRRHLASGRLAELVGDVPEAIESDKVVRTLGWRRVAEEEYRLLDDETRQHLQAYAEGVNAYLKSRDASSIAVEYVALSRSVAVSDPEEWDPVDSLTWLKAMAWDLRSNYDDELARAQIYSALGPMPDEARPNAVALVEQLFPDYPEEINPTILSPDQNDAVDAAIPAQAEPDGAALLGSPASQAAVTSARTSMSAVPALLGKGDGLGANAWAVAGSHTASGKPIVANDPHLAMEAPGVWSQVGLHCNTRSAACPYDVSGFSVAGFPGVVVGHNGQVAWGLSSTGADVTDFYIERVRNGEYLVDITMPGNTGFEPLETRTETIRVNGGQDVTIEVDSTKHGPIVSGVLDVAEVLDVPIDGSSIGDYQVSLAWTALDAGRTADAVFALNRAQGVEEVQAAAAMFDVPSQGIVFATADGHIGYQASGRVPIRQEVPGLLPSNGTWPRPGYDPRYDWVDYVSAEQMPRTLDPEGGIVVAANQAVLPAGSGPFLTEDWDYGYRGARIRALLEEEIRSGRPISVETTTRIQTDDASPYAEALVPILLEQEISDPFDAAGQELLEDWDCRMDPDSAAAAYFAAVWRNLLTDTFGDELPEGALPDGGSRWLAVVVDLLDDPTNSYWDDKTTFGVVENRDQILTNALINARRDLTVDLGKETSDWSWGALHQLDLGSTGVTAEVLPSVLDRFLVPAPVAVGGGSASVNTTAWDASSDSFAVTTGPSMRMVVDLGKLDESAWVTVAGVSGHPASEHFADQLDAWVDGETFRWTFTKTAVQAAGETRTTLRP